jgi:glycerophosphoryl diester phosphodiesterase
LEAFAGALELGSGALEMDVHLTADGVPVVIHDATVDRTTNAVGPVGSFSLEEIKALDAGYRFTPEEGRSFPYRGTGVTVPTLREVFTAFPTAHIVVDAKDNDTRLADSMIALVREFDRTDRTLLSSFYHDILVHFRKEAPEAPTHGSEEELKPLLIASWVFLSGLVSPDYEAVLVPTHDGRIPVTTRRFIRGAHCRNLFVAAWTINDPETMARLADRGIDGIITDRPDLALSVRSSRSSTTGQASRS